MVDLKGQYDAIKEELDISLDSVLNTTSFINGPAVKEFQTNLQKYLNVKHVIPCANGTDALQLAIMSLNLSPGDEIITSDFTFASTAEVVLLMGLKLRLVDINQKTFNIDPSSIERAITSKTKAIFYAYSNNALDHLAPYVVLCKQKNIDCIVIYGEDFIKHKVKPKENVIPIKKTNANLATLATTCFEVMYSLMIGGK